MTWREAVLKELREGYAEKGQVVDMVLLHERDVTQMLQLAMPTVKMQKAALFAAQKIVAANRGHIEDAVLIATVARGDGDKAVMVLFETKKGVTPLMFKPDGKTLTEIHAGKMVPFVGLGLWLNEPDTGGMYR